MEIMLLTVTNSALEFGKDRKTSDTISDIKISVSIKHDFIKKNFRDLYAKIKIDVVNGVVLLTGTVDNNEDIKNALQIAWNQNGVRDIINELKMDKDSNKFNLTQYLRDSTITSQIKSKIILDRTIKFANYTVITLDDIVYLFGISKSEDNIKKVASIASNIRGVKKVISHIQLLPPKKEDDLLIDQDIVEDYL